MARNLRKCLRLCVKRLESRTKGTHAGESAAKRLLQLNARSFQVPMTRNAQAVENHPGSIRPVERVEMNTSNIVSDQIMALFQRVLNASTPNHLGIILAWLQST